MATFPKYTQWTVQASATQLSSILATVEWSQKQCSSLVMRLHPEATGRLYWGPSTVTNVPANAGGVLKPGDAISWEMSAGRWLNTDNIYLVGTASATDILYITIMA